MTPRIGRLAALGLGLAMLAGCNSLNALNPFADKTPKPPCPRITIPADAANLTRFQPGRGEDLTDIQFEAQIGDIRFSCEHDIDKETRVGTLSMELTMILDASRGPADTTREATFQYFVTLLDQDRNILQKKIFPLKASFPGNFTRSRVTDDAVKFEVPLKAGQTGRDFLVYAGLQLSQVELDYNIRKRKATGR